MEVAPAMVLGFPGEHFDRQNGVFWTNHALSTLFLDKTQQRDSPDAYFWTRTDKTPGQWKERANQAGNRLFVLPELVPGTLLEGFERVSALRDPVARALMTMFVVTEVHPFRDGNGRTARLAMNCVLSAENSSRIIIPTIYREDYLLPLKRLTNDRDADPFIRSMVRAQKWTSSFEYGQSRELLKDQLKRCNAFEEDLKHFKLIFPETAS
ncbi:Fic family protein [Trinickia sp.]|uniref:Fic family protein n=1 Tax=Trinickia sp. TaxID=2571163 RepID=UPI003F81ECF3